MEPEPTDRLSDDQLADLARLADGTLPANRRAEVEARVAASEQLSRMVERQGVAIHALRATADTGAPVRLRAEVDRRRAGRAAGRDRRTGKLALSGALAAVSAAVIAVVLVLPGALSGGPSVAAAAALAERPPDEPAPRTASAAPALLRAEVDDVPFPNYAEKFGYEPVGTRDDEPSGRDATTVHYAKGPRRVAYTIVSGDALEEPADARTTTRGGVEYRTFRDDGRTVVTWERDGHTCVLSSTEAPSAELLALADWRGKGAIPF
jgi:hypothetical protein